MILQMRRQAGNALAESSSIPASSEIFFDKSLKISTVIPMSELRCFFFEIATAAFCLETAS